VSVSAVVLPIRSAVRSRRQADGIAAIGRARRLVATLGGRFSAELGLDVDRSADDIEQWALAATLFGNRISASVAMRTYRVLARAGVRTIADTGSRSWEELVGLLDEGGYVRYDERTARRLLDLAEAVVDRHGGRVAMLGERFTDPFELERVLGVLPGWGPVTTRAFLRELKGVWPGAELTLDERAVAAARHVQLPTVADALCRVAAASHLDVRDLEAGLVRLALSHDLARCPGGEECLACGSHNDRLLHF
jgi:hypothetical protein